MGTINQRIQQRREQLGLSKSQLAGKVKMTASAIYKLESGETRAGPKPENLYALAVALGTSMEWLAVGKESRKSVSILPEKEPFFLDQQSADLLQSIIQIVIHRSSR